MITLSGDDETGAGLVHATGELTIYRAAGFASELLGRIAGGAEVGLDLAGVTEFDSAGLQVLLVARREARARGGGLRLLHPSRSVLDVIETLNLQDMLSNSPAITPAEALTAAAAPAEAEAPAEAIADDASVTAEGHET